MSRRTEIEFAQALDGLAKIHADGGMGDTEYELKRSRLVAEDRKRKGRVWFWGTLALPFVLVTGCLASQSIGPSPDEFRRADPTGYYACSTFAQSEGAGGKVRNASLDTAAEMGLRASTPGIRAAVDDQNGGRSGSPVIPNHGVWKAACKKAGYDF